MNLYMKPINRNLETTRNSLNKLMLNLLEKNKMFEIWCTSKNVGSNFQRLQQIIWIEVFKNCIHSEIRTYLDEQKVETLEQAAAAADDCAQTHEVSLVNRK